MTNPNAELLAHARNTLAMVDTIAGNSPLPKEPATTIAFRGNGNTYWAYTRSWGGYLVPFAPTDDEDHRQSDLQVIARRGCDFKIISRPVDTSGDNTLDELLYAPVEDTPVRLHRLDHPNACEACGGPGNLHWGDCTRKANR